MPRKLFARHPVPKKKKFKEAVATLSDTTRKSFNDALDLIIKAEINDIISSAETILREKQRIKKAKKCIEIAITLMSENDINNTKFISKKYYNDLLTYQTSEVNSKFK